MQYKTDSLFDLVRSLVKAYAVDGAAERGAFSNDLSIIINGFEFAILSRQRGKGLVRVSEPLTGIVWAQECLNGDDICLQHDTEGNPAQWISVILRDRMQIPQDKYRVTPVIGIRFPESKGVSVCA